MNTSKAGRVAGNTEYVMFLQALIINAFFAAIVFWTYREGWISAVIRADTVYISRAIAGLGLIGVGMAMIRVFKVSRELNVAKRYREIAGSELGKEEADRWLERTRSRVAEFVNRFRNASAQNKPILVDNLGLDFVSIKLARIGSIGGWAVTLGALGTVVGLVIGVSELSSLKIPEFNFDPKTFNEIGMMKLMTVFLADVFETIKKVIGAFYIAFHTTIVGAFMGLWVDANVRWILEPGSMRVVSEATKIGTYYE